MSHKDKQQQNNFFKAMCTDNSQREDLEIFGKEKHYRDIEEGEFEKHNGINILAKK